MLRRGRFMRLRANASGASLILFSAQTRSKEYAGKPWPLGTCDVLLTVPQYSVSTAGTANLAGIR